MSKEYGPSGRRTILHWSDDMHIANGDISDTLHTLAECEAALSDDAHDTHRGRLARIRWLLMGLGVGRRLEPESEVREG